MSNQGNTEVGGHYDRELLDQDKEAIREQVGDGPFSTIEEVEGVLENDNTNKAIEAASDPNRQN